MASTYPGTLDSFATNSTDSTPSATTHPALHNDANDAINKIEAELGTDPAGSAATVVARFDADSGRRDIPGVVSALPIHLSVSAFTAVLANRMVYSRVTIPKTGTLHGMTVAIGGAAGNIRAAVYDTGQATSGTITRLWDGSSTAATPANSWIPVGDPALSVTEGQQVFFAMMPDTNTTLTIGYNPVPQQNALGKLPSGFPAAGPGLDAWISGFYGAGAFTTPSTLTNAAMGAFAGTFAIIAYVS